jgi:hypothetical protein
MRCPNESFGFSDNFRGNSHSGNCESSQNVNYEVLITDVKHTIDFYTRFHALRETRTRKRLLWNDIDFESKALKTNVVPKSPF